MAKVPEGKSVVNKIRVVKLMKEKRLGRFGRVCEGVGGEKEKRQEYIKIIIKGEIP